MMMVVVEEEVTKKKKKKKTGAVEDSMYRLSEEILKLPPKQNGFYKCTFKGCGELFSRAHTFKLHERTHREFSHYHKWKKEPQLFRDELLPSPLPPAKI
mmetsp:Transcript_19507/g.26835  ORF Transcript_19507/g.26835 Transcript_19507/m.26835 type:complete len:99 (+) Transcript_19507:45-341(+)